MGRNNFKELKKYDNFNYENEELTNEAEHLGLSVYNQNKSFYGQHLLKSSPKCVPDPHSPAIAAKIMVCRWTSWGGRVRTNEKIPRLHPKGDVFFLPIPPQK